MTIIIGIDPGSRSTGFGVIRCEGSQTFYLDSGHLPVADENVGDRLLKIYLGVRDVVQRYCPEEAAIEQIFMHQNPGSALKLGQARGAAIVALGSKVAEYSARQVKQSVVGYGAAKKEQVQHMVKYLLNLSQPLQADAADALAIALCHAHSRFFLDRIGVVPGARSSKKKSSWRNFSGVK